MSIKLHIIYGDHHSLPTIHRTDFQQSQLHWKVQKSIYCERKAYESVSIRVQLDLSQDYKGEDTHNERHRRIQYASLCEDERDDILHCPKAKRLACPTDNFFCESVSGMKRTIHHQRLCLHADKQTCHHEVEQRQNSQRFCGLDGETIQALSFQVAPTYGIETHIVENEPHQLTTNQHSSPLKVAGLFFECPLNLRIRTGNHRPWFSQTESKLSEKSLALPHTKINIKFIVDEGGQ